MRLFHSKFPACRLRRVNKFEWSRNLVRENEVTMNDFILAYFICEGVNIKDPLENLDGVYIYSVDTVLQDISKHISNGLNAIMLFPKVLKEKKSELAHEAYNSNNLICSAIIAIKEKFGNTIGVITDVALDPYTLSGHDGILDQSGYVANDKTIEILTKQALNQARAGADIVAPSDMMDGRVSAIRKSLDEHEFCDVQIMSYSVKFASSFYAPFRASIGSSSNGAQPLDKRSYQIDPACKNQMLKEVYQDIEEGADSIIIKPSLFYMDIINQASQNFNIPIVAYLVSGEYAMLMSYIKTSQVSEDKIFFEAYIGLKRAGANMIITYKIPYNLLPM